MDQYTYLFRDIPGYPEVRTSLYNTGGEGSIPDQGAKISYALCTIDSNTVEANRRKWFRCWKS